MDAQRAERLIARAEELQKSNERLEQALRTERADAGRVRTQLKTLENVADVLDQVRHELRATQEELRFAKLAASQARADQAAAGAKAASLAERLEVFEQALSAQKRADALLDV